MTIPLVPAAPFVTGVTRISATTANSWRANMAKCLDVVSGSQGVASTPATVCDIAGLGLKLSASGADGRLKYGTRQVPRQFALIADTTSGNWERASTPRGAWRNTASGGTLDIRLEGLPNAGVLVSITLRWDAAAGHAAFPGGAPAMPSIRLLQIDEDGTETSLGLQSDTSATAGAYEAPHDITLSSLSHTIDRENYRYVLVLTGETGANFVANGVVIGLSAIVAMSDQPEW